MAQLIQCPNPPAIDDVVFYEVLWRQAWDENQQHMLAITPRHYEHVSMNFAAMLKALEQQQAQIGYYRTCIARFNGAPP